MPMFRFLRSLASLACIVLAGPAIFYLKDFVGGWAWLAMPGMGILAFLLSPRTRHDSRPGRFTMPKPEVEPEPDVFDAWNKRSRELRLYPGYDHVPGNINYKPPSAHGDD